jgi:hypothetical protein
MMGWDTGISERVKRYTRASILTGYFGYLIRTVSGAQSSMSFSVASIDRVFDILNVFQGITVTH